MKLTIAACYMAAFIAVFCLTSEIYAKENETIMSKNQNTTVVLETTQGNIEIALMPDIAPKATENFIKHVQNKYYDGLTFHRVIKDFMIQGGDPTATGAGGQSIWGAPFEDEFNADVNFDKGGILAMANAGPNSNGSQFFITTVPTPWLHMRHTIFGKVVKGNDVVKKIEGVETKARDVPREPQKIMKAYVKETE